MKKQTNQVVSPVFLRGKRVILRPVSESDAPLFTKWFNDPEVRLFVKNTSPLTEQGELEWIRGLSKKSETDVVLAIEVKNRTIGVMGIHHINWKNRTATTGACIGEKEYWGKGYGTDAKMVLLNHAFNTLNLRKIQSRVYEFNSRSLAYSLHCGYVVEGRLKEQQFACGRYHDEIILGLFKEQWLPYWDAYQKGKSLKKVHKTNG